MRFINDVQNARDTNPILDLFAADMVNHTAPPETPHNLEMMSQTLQHFFAAFPDLSVEVELQIAEGDLVATRKRFCGTHTGEFRGIPPTGKRVDFAVMEFMEVIDRKITGHWGMVDSAKLMSQIEKKSD